MFAIISRTQRENGIPQDDYDRYRHFCTRRIERLRKQGGDKKPPLKTRKEAPASPKQPFTGSRQLTGEPQLWERLYRAERSWAYALALRKESVAVPRKRVHERKRWKRALQDSQVLLSLLGECCTPEMQAAGRVLFMCVLFTPKALTDFDAYMPLQLYVAMINAQVLFSQQKWTAAAQTFANYRLNLPEKLDELSTDLRDYVERSRGEAQSLEKYCQYMATKTGDQSTAVGDALFADGNGRAIFGAVSPTKKETPSRKAHSERSASDWETVNLHGKSWEVRPECLSPVRAVIEGICQDPQSVWRSKWQRLTEVPRELRVYLANWRGTFRLLEMVKQMVESEQLVRAFVSGHDRVNGPKSILQTLSHQLSKLAKSPTAYGDSSLAAQQGQFFQQALEFYLGRSVQPPALPSSAPQGAAGSASSLPQTEQEELTALCARVGQQLDKIHAARTLAAGRDLRITPFGAYPRGRQLMAAAESPSSEPFIIVEGREGLESLYREAARSVPIPMKPVFYDLAYDLLSPPSLS